MKAKIYIGAKKYALYIGRKIVEKTLEFLSLPARFVSKHIQDLKNLTMYGQSKQGILPDGYTQLEYIESTGTQYIDTGIKFNITHSYDLKFNTLSQSSSGIFGARSIVVSGAPDNDSIAIFANVSGTNTMYIDYNTRNIKTVNANTDVEITISPTKIILDGVSTPIVTKKTVNGTYNISLFGINTGGTIAKSNTRFYSFKIRDEQNKAVQNLIPAKRNSDNVSGMYDTVTNTFLTNAGTGEFVSVYTVPTPTAPIEVESVGEKTENLWNPNTVLINSWIGTDGKIGPASNGSVNVIEVEQNNTYYFTTFWGDKTGDTRYSCLAGFDADMNFVAGSRKILTQPNANNIEQVSTTIDNTSIKYIGFATYMTAPYSWMVRKNDNKTDYIPYGYKVPVVIATKGQNIFNKDNALLGYTINAQGVITPSDTYNCSNYVSVEYGKTYIRLNNTSPLGATYHLFNADKVWLGSKVAPSGDGTMVIDNVDCKYIVVAIAKTVSLDTYQIIEGTTPKPYEPYIQPTTTNIYLNEPLRKIGKYADTMSIDGTEVTVTRNVGSSTISSKNPISVRGDISNNRFLITNINQNALNDTSLICNLYKYDGQSFDGGANFTITGISSLSNGRVCIRDNRYNTLQDFQNYIINSNIEIILPLATPTTETYTIEQPIQLAQGTLTIDTDTKIKPSKINITGDIDNE